MAKVETLAQAARRYGIAADKLDGEVIRALNKIGGIVETHAKRNTPRDTGHMRRNWRLIGAKKEGDRIRAYIVNDVEYSFYVNYGHRAGSSWVEGRFMLEKAMRIAMPEFSAEIDERVKNLIERGAAGSE